MSWPYLCIFDTSEIQPPLCPGAGPAKKETPLGFRPLWTLEQSALAPVGPLEKQGERQADQAQAGEHDLARNVIARLVPQKAVEEREEPQAAVLGGGPQPA